MSASCAKSSKIRKRWFSRLLCPLPLGPLPSLPWCPPATQALAGTLHNVMNDKIHDVDFHETLLENHELLGRVALHNAEQNREPSRWRWTYLLSQVRPRLALPGRARTGGRLDCGSS